jgi:hypothetical protein
MDQATELLRVGKRDNIKSSILRWIGEQNLRAGDRIISQPEMAKIFEVSPVTIHHAMQELVGEGVIYRRKGKGTFVGSDPDSEKRLNLAMVLPGLYFDQEENNPECWHLIQSLFDGFMHSLAGKGAFSIEPLAPHKIDTETFDRLSIYDAVFFTGDSEYGELIDALAARGKPGVVVLGETRAPHLCLRINTDVREAVRLGMSHLIAAGYRRIAYLGSSRGRDKHEGYRLALAETGLQPDENLVVLGIDSQRDGARGAEELLRRQVEFDAIFVDTDLKAIDVISCLRKHGVSIPGDVGLMGHDGFISTECYSPKLTTVRVPHREFVQVALEKLQASGGVLAPETVVVPATIVPGETCRLGGAKGLGD